MKQVLGTVLAGIIALVVITGLLFYFGIVGNIFDSTITKQHNDIERENFKHSNSYVEGQIQDLAKAKREYDRAKSADEKQQVLNIVSDQFANFDESYIESGDLREFLDKARGGF